MKRKYRIISPLRKRNMRVSSENLNREGSTEMEVREENNQKLKINKENISDIKNGDTVNIKEKVRKIACEYVREKKRAKLEEIKDYIKKELGQDYNWIDEEIKQACVNYCDRAENTNSKKAKNCLFAINNKKITDDTYLELYNPSVHGHWEVEESSGKPYLKDLPDIEKYLRWLQEIYESDWRSEKDNLLQNLNNLKEYIENSIENANFEKDTYRSLCNHISYFYCQISRNIPKLFSEEKLEGIISIV
ncbi:MAG: hypothetical protein ABGX27_08780, partial [Desulfurobacteriaceae bacterium]